MRRRVQFPSNTLNLHQFWTQFLLGLRATERTNRRRNISSPRVSLYHSEPLPQSRWDLSDRRPCAVIEARSMIARTVAVFCLCSFLRGRSHDRTRGDHRQKVSTWHRRFFSWPFSAQQAPVRSRTTTGRETARRSKRRLAQLERGES